MLNEKLFDSNNSPIYLELLKIDEYPFHTHDEIEFIYLLKGGLNINVSVYDVNLTAGNIFLVNSRTLHYIKGMTEDDVALILHIDQKLFTDYYPNLDESIFICNSEKEIDNPYAFKELKLMIMQLAEAYYSDRANRNDTIRTICTNLFLILINNFQNWHIANEDVATSNIYKDRVFQIQRLRRIVSYIYMNYHKKITLGSLAEQEHVNKYYLSHLISTGLETSFQDFLSGVRAEKSLELLYGTKLKLEEVAEQCGFSSVNYFRKLVIEKVGDTPSSLRKKHSHKTITSMVPNIKKYNDIETIDVLKTVEKNFKSQKTPLKKTVTRFSVDISETGKFSEFKPVLGLYISDVNSIWDYDFYSNLKICNERLGIDHVAFLYDKLFDYKRKAGTWKQLGSFMRDLNELDLDIKLFLKEGQRSDSFTSYMDKIKSLKMTVESVRTENDITLFSDPVQALEYHAGENNSPTYLEMETIIDSDGYKLPPFYAYEFLNQMSGRLILNSNEYIVTLNNGTYKILTINNSDTIKDFLVNLLNINEPIITRVFNLSDKLDPQVENLKKKSRSGILTADIRKSIDKICEPDVSIDFIESTPEQDLFVTLNKGEAALTVIDKDK